MESSLFKAQQSHLKAMLLKADQHYIRQLLIRCGFAPWSRLLGLARSNEDAAISFHRDWLKSAYFSKLVGYCVAVRTEAARRDIRLTAEARAQYRSTRPYFFHSILFISLMRIT
jgi:hypothetical protein